MSDRALLEKLQNMFFVLRLQDLPFFAAAANLRKQLYLDDFTPRYTTV